MPADRLIRYTISNSSKIVTDCDKSVVGIKCAKQGLRIIDGLWLWRRGIKVGSFSYIAQPLGLGAAGGNQFEVTLRAVKGGTSSEIVSAVAALSTDGFVNYFGLQRFGSDNSSTHMCASEIQTACVPASLVPCVSEYSVHA